jgi:hypothetical protein
MYILLIYFINIFYLNKYNMIDPIFSIYIFYMIIIMIAILFAGSTGMTGGLIISTLLWIFYGRNKITPLNSKYSF